MTGHIHPRILYILIQEDLVIQLLKLFFDELAVNIGQERRCTFSPPSPSPCQPNDPPHCPQALPSPWRVQYEPKQKWVLMAAPLLRASSNHPVTSRLHECVDNGGWGRVLYDARGMEKITIIRKIPPAPTVACCPPQARKPGHPASERRRA
jgi:hypothetical protein